MIRFSCFCGHPFALDDSEAAGLVQCPACGKLNDVPTLHDLANLDEEGVIALKPVEKMEEPRRLEQLSRIYAKGRQDESGNDIDFRQTPEDFARRGSPGRAPEQERFRPRYDPETGQLMRPLAIAPPIPGRPVVLKPARLRPGRLDRFPSDPVRMRALLRTGNVFCMVSVASLMFFAGLFALLVYIPLPNATGGPPSHMLMMLGPMVVLELLAMAHYGNCIGELGPLYRDELPRLFGDVMLYENIWLPLVAVIESVLLCYGPAVLVFNISAPMLAIPLGSLLVGAGTYFFPAVLLILTSSGTLSNLRPDRVMGTITACGKHYLWCVFGWIVAGSIYLLAFLRFVLPVMGQLKPTVDFVPPIVTSLIMMPVLHLLTVPFAHAFVWQTAMLYRRYYVAFPWIGQRHEKRPVGGKEISI